MAFGIFKKKNLADVIFMNGHIFTQDAEYPWAGAVACKEGKVLAIGDFEGMDELRTEETQIIDLHEQYMFPGFIDVHDTPVLKTFEDRYLAIDPVWDLDTVLAAVADYAQDEEKQILFAYGYNEHILSDYDDAEDAHRLLDEIEKDRPVVLLGISGVHCWFNSLAAAMVEENAESNGLQYLSPDYVLNLLSPFDFEEIEQQVARISENLCEKGFTSVLNLYAPDYFGNLYQDCLIAMAGENEDIRQRFTGSLFVNRPLNPELILHKLSAGRTSCTEIDDLVRYDFLKLEVSDDPDFSFFSQDALNTICLISAEKGFHIHLDALDAPSAEKARTAFRYLREKGCRKNTLVLATDTPAEAEDGLWIETWPVDFLNRSVFDHCRTVREAIDELTVNAAAIIGRENDLGSIERGKLADFTVFRENPLDGDLRSFSRMRASMTVLDSLPVYDEEAAADAEMYDLLLSMRL